MELFRISEVSLKSMIDTTVTICGLLKSADTRPMKNGRNSITIILSDKDNTAEIKWFDTQPSYMDLLETGELFAVKVNIKTYAQGKDGISLIVVDNDVKKCSGDKREFVNWEDKAQWAYAEINKHLASVQKSVYGHIALNIIQNNLKNISEYPAASSMHHNGLGGLAVHIAGVAGACEELAGFYNRVYGEEFINSDLLISGALLHDIGKLNELDVAEGADSATYSQLATLGNHIMYGIAMIQASAIELGYKDRKEVFELIHLMGSHHGKKEYGSPIEPNCIEADILSRMDDLDAVAYKRNKAYKTLEYGEGKSEWKSGGLSVNYRATKMEKTPII